MLKIVSELNPNAEGWVSFREFLSRAAAGQQCTVLTIRNHVMHSNEYFEYRRGEIRAKKSDPLVNQAELNTNFIKWREAREAVLAECLEFLKVQTPSPYIENLLVQIASVREELQSYTDSKLTSLIMDLSREFNFSPKALPDVSEVK